MNAEIEALRVVEQQILPLDHDARFRIARWLSARVESDYRWDQEAERQRLIAESVPTPAPSQGGGEDG